MLPLGGLLIVVFAGWFMGVDKVYDELSNKGALKARYKSVYMLVIRYIAPIAIALVFLNSIGVLGFFTGE
jgi:NSS family neurotransmitter:Na+ symporter